MAAFRFRPIRLFAACAAVTISTPSAGYYISAKGPQHERLTALSEQCLRAAAGAYPQQCAIPQSTEAFEDGTDWSQSKFARASRWPDDPTREIGTGIIKFLINVGADRCEHYLDESEHPGEYAGILCHSHYGRLQFFHAMRPANASDEQTRQLIDEWTGYAFRVATGRIPLDTAFCDSVAESALRSALVPPGFPYCPGGSARPWTVRSFFAFRCGDPFSSKTCTVLPEDGHVSYAATGALIHLIQDSFSQSHVARGGVFPTGPYSPRVVCAPATGFYSYAPEQRGEHSDADKAPAFDKACDGSVVPDPITAVARLLWLAGNQCDERWAIQLIGSGVLGNRSAPLPVPASVQACRAAPSV
jgi:hypothetical protein